MYQQALNSQRRDTFMTRKGKRERSARMGRVMRVRRRDRWVKECMCLKYQDELMEPREHGGLIAYAYSDLS